MKVKFLDSMVEVKTCNESLLFSWMLFHKDAVKFKLGGIYASSRWDGPSAVYVKVKDDHHEYEQYIEKPIELSEKIQESIDSYALDYHNRGEYSYLNSKGEVIIAQGEDDLRFKVEDDFSITNAVLSTMAIHPDVKMLGIDEDSCMQYLLDFKYNRKVRLFYCIEDPLYSYFLME